MKGFYLPLKKNRSGNSEEGQECIRIDPQGTPTCMRETEPRGRRRGEAKEFKGNPRASGFVDEESALRNKKTQGCPMPQRERSGKARMKARP